jgi:hypothetical protein
LAPRILLLDATASPVSLEAMTPHPVVEVTPQARLEQVHPVYVFPAQDVAKSEKKSFRKVLAILRAVIVQIHRTTSNPRIGVIGHKNHVDRLKRLLEPELSRWVTRWSYFGKGDDVGDNGWYRECTVLVKLGTVRPCKRQIADHLIRTGRGVAANRDGDWGEIQWQDTRGVPVKGQGYRDPDWRLAYEDIALAADHQVLGRGRANLPDGIETYVFSSSFHQGAVAYRSLPQISQKLVDVVTQAIESCSKPADHACVESQLGDRFSITENVQCKDTTTSVRAAAYDCDNPVDHNSAKATARRRLIRDAVSLGLLERETQRSPARPTQLAVRIWRPDGGSPKATQVDVVE